MVIEKKIRFEFIQVGNFEPPAGHAPQQRAHHGIFKPRGRREDNVPQIDLIVVQCDAKHAAGGAVILVTSHNARERFLVGSDAPDFDGLADTDVAVDHDGCAVLTDVNGLTFPQEFFPTFQGGGNTNAQTQNDSFTAAKILFQDRRGLRTAFANRIAGRFAEILCQTTPPLKNRIDGNGTPSTQTT